MVEMNRFDELYDIRRIRYDEISKLQSYISMNWKKDHILSIDTGLLEYEYVIDDKVNFIIAEERNTEEIVGMIGYIPASSDKAHLDIWPTMWKVNENAMPLLGIELYKRLFPISGARCILGCGNNHTTSTVMLNAIMKYKNMKMEHFYRLSPAEEYQIAKIDHDVEPRNGKKKSARGILSVNEVTEVNEIERLINGITHVDDMPYKDAYYFIHRYVNYPRYKYKIWNIRAIDGDAVLISREQEYNKIKALRIVDYAGSDDIFSRLYDFFSDLLKSYEYVDLYEYGMDDDCLSDAGFVAIIEDDTNIIPNYFSPYVAANVDIWVSSKDPRARFFKADGDQDRPN